jgi:hypothetical protein
MTSCKQRTEKLPVRDGGFNPSLLSESNRGRAPIPPKDFVKWKEEAVLGAACVSHGYLSLLTVPIHQMHSRLLVTVSSEILLGRAFSSMKAHDSSRPRA